MKELPSRLHYLIGRQLDAKIVENDVEFGKSTYKVKSMKFAEGVIKQLQDEVINLGYSSIRFKYTGGIYTQDIRMGRLNIEVSDDGVITSMYFG